MDSLRKTLALGGSLALTLAWLSMGGSASAAQAAQAAKPAPIQVAPHGEYAGTEKCLACHEDSGAALKTGAHSRSFRAGTPTSPKGCQACHAETKANLGCEGCHGPGKAHVDADGDKTKIKSFKSLKAQDASAVCSSCHFRTQHALWAGSQHDQRNVGCTGCHSIHAPKGDKQLKAVDEMQLCAGCHRSIVNKQLKFHHMAVREGKLTCASCHNVHGTSNVKLLKVGGTVSESCVSCHAEKRGPMLWEHAPVAEDCALCHTAHGSVRPALLTKSPPLLCQQCHTTAGHPSVARTGAALPGGTAGGTGFLIAGSCTNCHTQVHGSNHPAGSKLMR
jgi:DmsE family decaheme c-type cytochrome